MSGDGTASAALVSRPSTQGSTSKRPSGLRRRSSSHPQVDGQRRCRALRHRNRGGFRAGAQGRRAGYRRLKRRAKVAGKHPCLLFSCSVRPYNPPMPPYTERATAAFWATFRGLVLLELPDRVWLTQQGRRLLLPRCSSVGLNMNSRLPLLEFKATYGELLRREQARQLQERPLDRAKLGERNWEFLRDFLPEHEQHRLRQAPSLTLVSDSTRLKPRPRAHAP